MTKKYVFRNYWDCHSPDEMVSEDKLYDWHKEVLTDKDTHIEQRGKLTYVHYRLEDVCY